MVVKLIMNDMMDRIDDILFNMVREAILRAIGHGLIITTLISVVYIAPLYIIIGLVTKSSEKVITK